MHFQIAEEGQLGTTVTKFLKRIGNISQYLSVLTQHVKVTHDIGLFTFFYHSGYLLLLVTDLRGFTSFALRVSRGPVTYMVGGNCNGLMAV